MALRTVWRQVALGQQPRWLAFGPRVAASVGLRMASAEANAEEPHVIVTAACAAVSGRASPWRWPPWCGQGMPPAIEWLPCTQRINHVNKVKQYSPPRMLRVAVKSGGCSGFSYALSFTDTVEPEDRWVRRESVPLSRRFRSPLPHLTSRPACCAHQDICEGRRQGGGG